MQQKITGKCTLCQKHRPLIRAHELPKAFQKFMTKNKQHNTLYWLGYRKEKKTDSLPFNKTLFCALCDNSFSSSEQEIVRLSESLINNTLNKNKPNLIHTQKFDTFKIKNALLFLLYKLSLSKISVPIDLGEEYEQIVKNMLLTKQFTNKRIAIYLAYHPNSDFFTNDAHKKMFVPIKGRSSGQFVNANCSSVLIPGALEVIYKIDKRPIECPNHGQLNILCFCSTEICETSNDMYITVQDIGIRFDEVFTKTALNYIR